MELDLPRLPELDLPRLPEMELPRLPEGAPDVFTQQRAAVGAAQLGCVPLDDLSRFGVGFHQGGVGGAAGECLEGERSRAGVQVEDAEAVAALPEQVEEALPDAIGGRPRGAAGYGVQRPAAQVAADDPHSFCASAASRFERRGAVVAAPARAYSSCAS